MRAAHVALWALVGLALLSGLSGLALSGRPPTAHAPRVASALPPEAAGVAEMAVANFLARGEAAVLVDPAPDDGAPGTGDHQTSPPVVGRTAAVASRSLGGDYWAVVVAAERAERGTELATAHVAFFEVGVLVRGGGAFPVGTPAEVAAPSVPPPPPFDGPEPTTTHGSDPVVATAEAFLAALLTGDGEAERYLAPGTRIAAPASPPYRQVRVDRAAVWGEGGQRWARLAVDAVTAGGRAQPLEYQLHLVERAGRWEIDALSGAPRLRLPALTAASGTNDNTKKKEAPQ